MSSDKQTPAQNTAATPLQGFSDCHAGIVGQLQQLARLPGLIEPARQAREIAAQVLAFFDQVVVEHHSEEERELFPAVLASAAKGAEHEQVRVIIEQLTREHREVEAVCRELEPALKAVARGADAALDAQAVAGLVSRYLGHARYEEEHFLPLAQQILSRNSDHMAALGLALHLRHALPEVLARYGSRI